MSDVPNKAAFRTRRVVRFSESWYLSVCFALLMMVIANAEIINSAWRVEAYKPAPVTLRVPPHRTVILDAQGKIVHSHHTGHVFARGSVTDKPIRAAIIKYSEARRRPLSWKRAFALWAGFFALALMFSKSSRRLSPGRGALMRTQLAFFAAGTVIFALFKVGLLFTDWSPLWAPVAFLPLWLTLNFDRRLAYLASIVFSLGYALMLEFEPIYITVQLSACIAASGLARDRKHLSAYAWGGFRAALAGFIAYALYREVLGPPVDWIDELALGPKSAAFAVIGGGLVSGMLALAFQQPLALLLGSVPRGRLLDFSDLDHPLLRKMAAEAPGSWEHSRTMANLAEEAAASVGADTLLIRVGAYFHDLGKSVNPKYFVENLEAGEESPHHSLAPDESAYMIMSHVTHGVKILREGNIPEPIVEFAYTHHGTSLIEYFWHKCIELGNPKGLTESDFRYPGMKPRTRETGILMLVDAIEAASRTVSPPDRESFRAMITRIVFDKLKQGQLDESGLTMFDLRIIIQRLLDALVSLYHNRVRYPWQEEDARQKAKEEEELAAADGQEATFDAPSRPRLITREDSFGGRTSQRAAVRASVPPPSSPPSSIPPSIHNDHDDRTYPGGKVGRR